MRASARIHRSGLVAVMMLLPCLAVAHDRDSAVAGVVPEGEYATADRLDLEGPAETRGVASVEQLGAMDLAEEFPHMEGRQFRARVITIEPGGVVAVHRHRERPGLAYILAGEIVEHRNDHPEPLVRRTGDMSMEKTGVAHWWENRSGENVRALVVDIVPADAE